MKIDNNIDKTLDFGDNKKDLDLKNDKFIQSIKESLKSIKTVKNLFTFENIKNISLDEIDTMFKNEEEKLLAKNLKLASMFSNDENLAKVMYDTVLEKPLDLAYYFLKDRYEDKANFLNARGSNTSLADLLHQSLGDKLSNKNTTDVIPKEQLNLILERVYSFDFISAFSSTSKDQYGRYKDKDDDYAFLYNNYALEYQEIEKKYKKLDEYNKQMIEKYK